MTKTLSPSSDRSRRDSSGTCVSEVKRYEGTVAAVVSLLRFVQEQSGVISEFALGPSVRTEMQGSEGGKAVRPDFVAAYGDPTDRSAFVLDVKWSLPENHQGLVDELLDIRRYTGPLSGWPTPASTIVAPDLAILCHHDDAARVREVLSGLHHDDENAYGYLVQPGYSVWSWGEVKTRDGLEVIRISKLWGAVRNQALATVMNDNIDIPKERFLVESTWVKFVGDRPPLAYVILIIIQTVKAYVFGYRPEKQRIVSLDNLYQIFQSVFRAVGKGSGPQVDRASLRTGLELLAEIGYNVTKLDEDEVQELHLDPPGDWYRFERRSPHQDLYEWICSKIVEVETKRISRRQRPARRFRVQSTRRRKVKVAHTQKTLPGY